MPLKPKADTIVEILCGLENCSGYGARFVVPAGGEDRFYPYSEVVQRAKTVAGNLQEKGLRRGDRVAIILPTGIHFLDAFLGTQLAGGIPAAIYPPFRMGRLKEYFHRTRRMLAGIDTRFLLTDSRIMKILGAATEGVSSLEEVLRAETLLTPSKWSPVEIDPGSPAFLQFSSGTTIADPKAVIVSHTNLLFNLEMMESLFRDYPGYSEEYASRGGVCWLPLYHDMGLIGCVFNGLYHPGTVTYIGPEAFIANPQIWFRTLSRYRAVISPAPDFAYGLCLKRIKDMEGVDLSNWKVAPNGAEPIDPKVMRDFCEQFSRWGFRPEAMTPVYGLAEAGLAVTFSGLGDRPLVTEFDRGLLAQQARAVPGKGRRLVSVGRPLPDLGVEIRKNESGPLEEGRVGRIFIKGPSITKGFFNNRPLTEQAINEGWLNTGDLGFFYSGNLYITGRQTDLIDIGEAQYAPEEIEELIKEVEGLRTACTVAVAHIVEERGQQLIVLAEKDVRCHRPEEEIVAEIGERLLSGISMTPHHVQLLDPGTLPRTSSGKMRRGEALSRFLSGELAPPEKMGAFRLFREISRSQIAWGRFWLNKRQDKP